MTGPPADRAVCASCSNLPVCVLSALKTDLQEGSLRIAPDPFHARGGSLSPRTPSSRYVRPVSGVCKARVQDAIREKAPYPFLWARGSP